MRIKIRDILLVSSIYDYYLFEEDGRLYELIRSEYQNLNLSQAPEVTHVTTGTEALDLLRNENQFDLIITTLHIEDMHVINFANEIKKEKINLPIILLAYDNKERKELTTHYDTSVFERIFIWSGDFHLLIGIIKYLEDKMNVENDTQNIGVQVIILVEDNIKFYSSYLPLIYTEIFNQSQRLLQEGINITHKFLRMRARPKILLCSKYEEAWAYYEKYEKYVLGIILDNNFRHNEVRDSEAGLKFATEVNSRHKDIPILIQTSDQNLEEKVKELGVSFLYKNSPRLLHHLRQFMLDHFGFGDFVFQMRDGEVVGRASNLMEFADQIGKIPDESLVHHAERNHFSRWLKARTEFYLAHKLRPQKVSDYKTPDHLRNDLINAVYDFIDDRQRGVISEFNKETFDPKNSFARIGGGSLGGKARGLGFINSLITNYNVKDLFKDIEVSVPSAIVIGTEIFDDFIRNNNLEMFALQENDDLKLTQTFIEAPYFSHDIEQKLTDFLEITKVPLAVRSSSLLEDSQFQPFAGVYQTYMLPNSNPDITVRLEELLQTIKCVYASTYHQKVKDYMKATSYRLEEEKMAVIVQRLVGSKHGEKFYPDFAGVGKSFNFYPVPPQKSDDGIALVALGLGKTVVEGGNTVRFCPRFPKHLLQFFSTKETLMHAQQDFYALDLKGKLDHHPDSIKDPLVKKYELTVSEEDGTLYSVGSTYSTEDEAVYDGISRDGIRVVTFSPILKHKMFPLPEILNLLLNLGTWGMGSPVEIEFAVNLSVPKGKPKEFAMLQMRPLVISRELDELKIDFDRNELICESRQVLGNGATDDIFDLVFVDINKFDRGKSKVVAGEIAQLNSKLLKEKKPYVLVGIGRWGSLDPWLGIPVTWDQISGAAAIVESGFKNFEVEPSQGSHFFQNITSFRVGYFTVDASNKIGFIDWDWLQFQKAVKEFEFTKHLQFQAPISVRINGHKNKGIIIKPGNN
ncbi:MAG: histidine kinase [Ignavibacteria bacterium]|nr:histidine kinase [Ignavibacteria bacterium]MBT8383786.1 histidine kinase [Ignavibacteria bacterium]MBT8392000.1 histidine kinase [Ignavibacteria bacterium]NNJ52329.1 histidine kinase [Ignavibacteriaceae bacterium]NNL21061.1 histidine kinase [Ignavibacteriaceae bacterium]